MSSTRYKIVLSYDGSAYAGWQVQPSLMTVQQRIQEAVRRITGETAAVHGSGRTDQGVHARRQVAHFDLKKRLPVSKFRSSLNAVLPPDIRIVRAKIARRDFDARRSAVFKEYRYFIWNADIVPPFLRHYRAHVLTPLDVEAMRKAAKCLVGRHDFAAFAANPNRRVESTVRNLSGLAVRRRGPEIVIIAKADGFLYKMVRSIAGFLIAAGEGRLRPEEACAILRSGVRTARVPSAQPQGLFLWNVVY